MQISHLNQINGGVIRFFNKEYNCGERAGIRISETTKNPNNLFFLAIEHLVMGISHFGSIQEKRLVKVAA